MIPGMDGIRCVAVLMVVSLHLQLFRFGWVGLQMFFVLSGFLITRLLIDRRDQPLRSYLGTFYGRRALRILPALYAFFLGFLALSVIFDASARTTENWGLAAGGIYNWMVALDPEQYRFYVSHLWSLCVEEQFYLIWPLVIYFTPSKRLVPVMLAIILAAPISRYLVYYVWPAFAQGSDPAFSVYLLPTTHMDAFAMGALLCVRRIDIGARLFVGALMVLFALGYANAAWNLPPGETLRASALFYPVKLEVGALFIWGYSAINLCMALMLAAIVGGRFLPRFFEHPVVDYIGKISYPTYILHLPIMGALLSVSATYGIETSIDSGWFVVACLVPTFGLAALAHHWIEVPADRLKRVLFSYEK